MINIDWDKLPFVCFVSTMGRRGGIVTKLYYIQLQHLYLCHIFSPEDRTLFSQFKTEMDRLKVNTLFYY